MNWYRLASKKPTLNAKQFLKQLMDCGVVVERVGKKGYILLNPANNQRTNMHSHRKGIDLRPDAIRKMLRDLGLDYWEFMTGKPRGDSVAPGTPSGGDAEQQTQEKNIPEWQKAPWCQRQQQYRQ
jgi:hypothetical protein